MRLARAPSAQVQGPCPLNLTHRRQRRRIGPQQKPGERGSKHIVVLQRGIDSGVGRRHTTGLAHGARRLVELALGAPSGLVPDVGGPRTYAMRDLVRDYLRATGRRRAVVQVPVPGAAGAAYRAGANLAPDRAVGHGTWEEFLAERFPSAARVHADR